MMKAQHPASTVLPLALFCLALSLAMLLGCGEEPARETDYTEMMEHRKVAPLGYESDEEEIASDAEGVSNASAYTVLTFITEFEVWTETLTALYRAAADNPSNRDAHDALTRFLQTNGRARIAEWQEAFEDIPEGALFKGEEEAYRRRLVDACETLLTTFPEAKNDLAPVRALLEKD